MSSSEKDFKTLQIVVQLSQMDFTRVPDEYRGLLKNIQKLMINKVIREYMGEEPNEKVDEKVEVEKAKGEKVVVVATKKEKKDYSSDDRLISVYMWMKENNKPLVGGIGMAVNQQVYERIQNRFPAMFKKGEYVEWNSPVYPACLSHIIERVYLQLTSGGD